MYSKFRSIWSSISTLLLAFVPVFKSCPPCPICMPKYAAILSFFGLELADYSQYLAPIMLLSMAFTLYFMYRQIRNKRLPKYPFYTALTSCILLLTSKYIFDNSFTVYSSMILLLVSVLIHNKFANKKCCNSLSH